MADVFNFYLIDLVSADRGFFDPNGFGSHHPGRVCNLIKSYTQPVIDKVSLFSSVEVAYCPDTWFPALLPRDVVVYLVSSPKRSVIKANGGNVDQTVDDDHILGLTDLNLQICEVYFDRTFEGSPKEVAGAAYHEAIHLKSNQDNSMHGGKDGFLTVRPDYNGSPTKRNTDFFALNIGRSINQIPRTLPR